MLISTNRNKALSRRLKFNSDQSLFYAQNLSIKNGENNSVLAGVPFLSSSRAPHALTRPNSPFPFPFYCQPHRLANTKLVYQILHPPEILLSHSRARNGSFCHTKLNPIPVVSMDKMNIAKMRESVSEHGQCVRQLCVRQQTTKFSAGTLPMSARVGYKPTNVGRSH